MRLLPRVIVAELFLTLAIAASSRGADVDEAVRQWLLDTYRLDTAWCQIEVLANPFDSTAVESGRLDIRALTQTEPIGLFSVLVTIRQDDGRLERGQVRMRIRKFAEVLIATDRIQRHDLLTPTNLSLDRAEVTSLREQPVQSLGELDHHRARRNIRKGQVLTTMAIEPVPDIEVGREVTIVVSNETLTITAPGQALESGSHGEFVKVKNKATGKILKARVLDENSVAVDL